MAKKKSGRKPKKIKEKVEKKVEEADVNAEHDQEKHDETVSEHFNEKTEVQPVEVDERPPAESVPAKRPEGAPDPSDCIAEYETKYAFIYKLKNHRKVIVKK